MQALFSNVDDVCYTLQVLTLLEGAIKRDFLCSSFETTEELLNSTPDLPHDPSAALSGPVPVLPWIPETTAAVAFRLLDLDASILYALKQKSDFHKEKEAAGIIVCRFSFRIEFVKSQFRHLRGMGLFLLLCRSFHQDMLLLRMFQRET